MPKATLTPTTPKVPLSRKSLVLVSRTDIDIPISTREARKETELLASMAALCLNLGVPQSRVRQILAMSKVPCDAAPSRGENLTDLMIRVRDMARDSRIKRETVMPAPRRFTVIQGDRV